MQRMKARDGESVSCRSILVPDTFRLSRVTIGNEVPVPELTFTSSCPESPACRLGRITVGSNIAQTVGDSFPENKWYPSIPVKGRLHPDGARHGANNE
jgi:hypothetical protein